MIIATSDIAVIRSFDGMTPQIAESAYVDEAAVLIGDVVVREDASIWPNATLRGDAGQIVVGDGANVQDNAVLHENAVLESRVTVGHCATVHAATVSERALIGMNAVVLDDSHIGENAVVAAGSVVTEGTEVPAATLMAGIPAELKKELKNSEQAARSKNYIRRSKAYKKERDQGD